jgi:hypothetical protein
MKFTTKVNIPKSAFNITHQDSVLLLGSCFTENIGLYLKNYQFKTIINPFGIIYNPISIFNTVEKISRPQYYNQDDLIYNNELFISLDHHGDFSALIKDIVLDKINNSIEESHIVFKESKYIVFTFGTSFVYEYLANKKIVANCHKIPNNQFLKRILSIEEIVEAFNKIAPILSDKTIIFTVSPVRHWRDGAIENQRSKSILVESIHQIIEKQNNCFYFPAYEIMMDELRDYRFYSEDMLHPNNVAIKYIWQCFSGNYFSDDTQQINHQIEKINLLLQHKIKNPNTQAQIDFENKIKQSIADFKKQYPTITVNF